jgi:hypothetical protein
MRFAPAGDWFPSKNLGAVLLWGAEADLITLSSANHLKFNARKASICSYQQCAATLSAEAPNRNSELAAMTRLRCQAATPGLLDYFVAQGATLEENILP